VNQALVEAGRVQVGRLLGDVDVGID